MYRFLPHYRVDFFSRLQEELSTDRIDLQLVYGRDVTIPDLLSPVDWADPVINRSLRIGGRSLIWQPIPRSAKDADLIILMQESRLLSNYALLMRGILGHSRVALWGHGIDFQQEPGSRANRFKRFYSRRAHWWFAYTRGVADLIADSGFPRERITIVDNAIDTRALLTEAARVTAEFGSDLRSRLGLGSGPVGIYCGRLYDRKRLPFLLQASKLIRSRLPSFELIVIGDGPSAPTVSEAAAGLDWVHFVGPKMGMDRVPYFVASDAFLNPGAIGLAILDAFALETPLVTTKVADHGPEIEYLVHGTNGILTENTMESFVDGAVRLLSSPELQHRLWSGCRSAAEKHTIEGMVRNFGCGVRRALEASR